MSVFKHDREVLRELAEKIANIAAAPIHKEKVKMWKNVNSLKSEKPMVWFLDIPWHEMGVEDELKLKTTNEFYRKIEREMRRKIYKWEHMKVDMVVEPKITCPLVINNSGFGIEEDVYTNYSGFGIEEDIDTSKVDSDTAIYSRHFHVQIKDEEDIQKIKTPKIRYDKGVTEKNYEIMSEIFDGILEVEKCGETCFTFSPWDELIKWIGVQEGLTALALQPEFIHKCMERLTQAYNSMLDQYEKLNLLSLNNWNHRISSGGPGYADELPQLDFNPKKVKAVDLWGFSAAQIFSDVSPQMHEEFALNYELRWLERFGLNYYGCCEPLHKKIDIIKKIPNLRKISISPWANLEEAVLQIGNSYVLSYKPNPSIFAEELWNPENVRRDLINILEKTKGYHVEIIMKDISTVRYQPQRLWEWAKIADELTQDYY
jgi:hypothetical protein